MESGGGDGYKTVSAESGWCTRSDCCGKTPTNHLIIREYGHKMNYCWKCVSEKDILCKLYEAIFINENQPTKIKGYHIYRWYPVCIRTVT